MIQDNPFAATAVRKRNIMRRIRPIVVDPILVDPSDVDLRRHGQFFDLVPALEQLKVNRLLNPFLYAPLLYGLLLAAALNGGASVVWAQSASPTTSKPPVGDEGKGAVTMPKSPEGNVAAVDTKKYLLGPEDVIYIRTWREPDFTFVTAIRPDGKITLPLYGDIQAGGLTPEQLSSNIKEALTKYINTPDVQVFVQDVRSKKYFVDGQVKKTGRFPLVTKITVLEALSDCGGFMDFANLSKIDILRGSKILHFNYKQVTHGKHLEQNIDLEDGDHIIVH